MKITIYKCDICKAESRDAKLLYAPKTKPVMSIMEAIRERFRYEDICVNCFDSFHEAACRTIDSLKVVDNL